MSAFTNPGKCFGKGHFLTSRGLCGNDFPPRRTVPFKLKFIKENGAGTREDSVYVHKVNFFLEQQP